MNLKFDKATSTLTASVSQDEQICLNDAELPKYIPTAVRGKELKRQIYTERTRIMRDWRKPVEVVVVLENTGYATASRISKTVNNSPETTK